VVNRFDVAALFWFSISGAIIMVMLVWFLDRMVP
jgi:hypothetical protein